MGGGLCQPPRATSDGGLVASAPQCQTHGASLANLCLGATLGNSVGLKHLTLGISTTHHHVTGSLQELLGSHRSSWGSDWGRGLGNQSGTIPAPDEHSMTPTRPPCKPLCATSSTVTMSPHQSIKKEPLRALELVSFILCPLV